MMCGIAGKLSLEPDGRVDAVTVRRMCRVLAHRGPDDEGVHVDRELGMGMRRLKIIDLATGRQPMTNEDGTVWTVFNGEIYNYRELRSALERAGHRFVTNSDTEVIVHGYEEYGEDFVNRLTGMFAIAVWDARRRTLILARDRLGIKPLYYLVDRRRLVFASEIKALLQDGVPRDVDPQALHDYLALGYVPGPRSIFGAIRKVQAGHLVVCTQDGAVERRYWRLTYPAAPTAPRPEAGYAEELRALLKSVTADHLLSDVPLGVFLSGGVDSSTLVALMRELGVDPLRTFSIGFAERSYNELDYARVVAHAFGTDHHEMVVRPDAATLLPELVRSFDEPFADSSAIPVSCVSRLARQQVTVALSGEGGDEVFGGYVTYRAYKVANLYRHLPAAVTRLMPALVRRLPTSHRRVSFDYKAKRFVEGALLSPADAHCWWKLIFNPDAAATLYAAVPPFVGDASRLYRESWESCGATDALTRLQHIDLSVYLPDDLLVKADRMSMAASLEVRVPFVDHRIVEFAASLPPGLKVRRLTTKYILKRAMAGAVPARILSGKKRGFNVPIAAWLVRELREMVHDVLSETRVRRAGFFDPAAVSALIRAHEARQADYSRNIYALLMFSLWCDEYLRHPVDDQPTEAPTLAPQPQPSPPDADIRVGVTRP
jgi:asparagine synthase (glutamine-hydrolysing)